jgi:MerR family Zn(II)-responsive transcriptional regulator of zntA
MEDTYSIGALVKELKINKETIRYYEKIGLLSVPQKSENGYRRYSKEDIDTIRFILIVKNFGFSLKEIRMLIHDEILCGNLENIKRIVENKLREVDVKINELEETKKVLEKVKEAILSPNIQCCGDTEMYKK